MKQPSRVPLAARTRWSTLVAVCSECDGGKRLAKAMRRNFKREGTGDVRVVRSSCMDVCPKRGVTVTTMRAGVLETAIVMETLAPDA
jgi:hypothetical protein